ncbi:PROTEIN ABCI7 CHLOROPLASTIC [Salix purpurea]|uniref:PROTEIN ABCI7 CHLOROPLASTIC n=1 Tax=Salix purpurea TaxID=77065 RepID=A0A9Q0TI37_SALPP|nr:PROTEIN ABCI7 CHLOROPLASTIC [Salix purpurea]
MSASAITPQIRTPITPVSLTHFVLQLAETLEDSLSPSVSLQKLRDSSSESLLSTSWPSRKDEPFRFTDTSFIRHSQIIPIIKPPQLDYSPSINEDTLLPNLVIADGFVLNSMSNLSNLPDRGLFEGGEEGSKKLPVSNPRVFVVVEEGGEVGIIEEFVSKEGNDDKYYWANPVLEVVIGKGAKVRHSYVQSQSLNSAHIKWTAVRQEAASTYELVEVSTGGKLSRHNLHVQQLGPDTATELSTFHLSVGDQTQDLHSRLILDHPRGHSQQLHKCIVAHSQGQAVFDGNVKVNRYAQQTDAGQLTRSLLLEPRATVNVKPNLQIIADDVKCSHGAAISDLEETQLFYFLARGIDLETARKALVFSFGAEVIERLPNSFMQKQVESHVKGLLSSTFKGSSN